MATVIAPRQGVPYVVVCDPADPTLKVDPNGCVYLTDDFVSILNRRFDRIEEALRTVISNSRMIYLPAEGLPGPLVQDPPARPHRIVRYWWASPGLVSRNWAVYRGLEGAPPRLVAYCVTRENAQWLVDRLSAGDPDAQAQG